MPTPTPPAKQENKPNTPTKPVETKTPPAKPGETKTPPAKPAETKPVIDWDALPPATVDTGVAKGDTVDVEKEIPAVIRKDVEESLSKFLEKQKTAGDGKRVPPVWLVKPMPNEEAAKEFTRLAKRYAQYRPAGQLTLRGGPLKKDPTKVRFCAKPYEQRGPRDKTPSADKK